MSHLMVPMRTHCVLKTWSHQNACASETPHRTTCSDFLATSQPLQGRKHIQSAESKLARIQTKHLQQENKQHPE